MYLDLLCSQLVSEFKECNLYLPDCFMCIVMVQSSMTDLRYGSLYARLSSNPVLRQYSCYLDLIQVNAVIIMLTVYCNNVLEVNPFTATLFSRICFFGFMPSTWLLIMLLPFIAKQCLTHGILEIFLVHVKFSFCNNSLKFVLVQQLV